MGVSDPPQGDRERIVPLIESVPEKVAFLDLLLPLLEEEATRSPEKGSTVEGTERFAVLLEENARLRALAAELSNLLGDLPTQEWSAAFRLGR